MGTGWPEPRLGMSAAALEVEADIGLAASTHARVLISGEPGVGKQAIARVVHGGGPRRNAPFVPVRCAGTSEGALHAELFGGPHARPTDAHGPAALERADGGTLFLGEIGEMGLRIQEQLEALLGSAALPPAIPTARPPADVRIIASSGVPLVERVASGRFREDLFYRLNVIHIAVPPLRRRREDIGVLLSDSLARAAAERCRAVPDLTPEAWQHLCRYDWPGNLREMRLVAARLVERSAGGPVGLAELSAGIVEPAHRRPTPHV